jgi:hypothetical protein
MFPADGHGQDLNHHLWRWRVRYVAATFSFFLEDFRHRDSVPRFRVLTIEI